MQLVEKVTVVFCRRQFLRRSPTWKPEDSATEISAHYFGHEERATLLY
jgi:hypothetical protein